MVFSYFFLVYCHRLFPFFPVRVAHSLKFYSALFPQGSLAYHLFCVWKQYHNFTDVFLDRFLYYDRDS